MSLQAKVLDHYLDLFGRDQTLKQISGHLGIQVTRVFRIFNGYEMKITEFEKFQNCLLYTSPSPRDQRGSRMPSSA